MSMIHRAYVFDDVAFDRELRGLLGAALSTDDAAGLRTFIATHRHALTDPYDFEPLPDDWESVLQRRDVQEYGDFAFSKYYDRTDDIGLRDWIEFNERFESEGLDTTIALGAPVGVGDRLFDPGLLGSYIQTAARVRDNLKKVEELEPRTPALRDDLRRLREMLAAAAQEGRGLYVTF